ncbi:MAG TPA: GNAT family N-acetyltransferase [Allocoleopsis sp.]
MIQNLSIRTATIADIAALAQLFTHTVETVAPQSYSPEQVQAWAKTPADLERFQRFILEVTTFVAVLDGRIVGFAGVAETGYLASLYTHSDYQRQGIGSELLKAVLEYAQAHQIERLYTEASEFSKPLFEKFGFAVYEIEQVNRGGVWFNRSLMQRWLSADPDAATV